MICFSESIVTREDIQAGRNYTKIDCWLIFFFERYYFKVDNTKKGHKVRFNIVNLSRSESLYQQVLELLRIKIIFIGNETIYSFRKTTKNQW